jgi:hypothetical protein
MRIKRSLNGYLILVHPVALAGLLLQFLHCQEIIVIAGMFVVAVMSMVICFLLLPERSFEQGRRIAVQRSVRVFSAMAYVLPERFAEYFGDALEDMSRMEAQQRSPALIYLRLITSIYWIWVDAARELWSGALRALKRVK